jgi:putative Mg2+ transporter-C (MgtC) family protein
VPDLSWVEVLIRVGLAAVLGGAIGAEREFREREAGLRTHMLVSVGSALFTLVSAYAWRDFEFSTPEGIVFDPTRIAAQIVSGIGFLGAGAIIRQGLSIRGLTTAATLWVVAAIGMASGAGYYSGAVITTVLVIVALGPVRLLAGRLIVPLRPEEGMLAVELRPGARTTSIVEAVEGSGGRVRALEFQDEGDRRRVDVRVKMAEGREAAELVDALAGSEDVVAARWNP